MAKKTVKKEEYVCLDLGCGSSKSTPEYFRDNSILMGNVDGQVVPVLPERVIGVDFAKCEGVDVIHDLTNFPYPFKDNSVDAIFSSHFVEHLDGFERAKFMDECFRILKTGGKMRFVHPYYKSVRAIQDFSHKFPPISENTYLYWDKNWREANKLTHGVYDLKSNFEFAIYYSWQDNIWANKNEETRNFAVNHYFNVVADMVVDLKKR